MKKEHQEYLCKTYPKLYNTRANPHNQKCRDFGFDVGDGWFTILNGLSQCIQEHTDQNIKARWRARKRIRALQGQELPELSTVVVIPARVPQVHVDQIKEKFGTLRFYIHGGNDAVYDYIHLAETMSGITCEDCGSPGERSSPRGWIRTLCSVCEKGKSK